MARFADHLGIPAERGVPMDIIGTNGKAPEDEYKPAYLRPQGLHIQPISDLTSSASFISICESREIRVLPKATRA
jgi:hypothetical protein